MRPCSAIALATVLAAGLAQASNRLLYFEAQGVAGYSSLLGKTSFYSATAEDAMQRPSLGFDLLQRLAGESGDWGAIAVQARLSYDQSREGKVEPQLYNAYLKVKPGIGDVWLGHSRPAFGLSSTIDNHAALLQPLSMRGFGYDRDWGLGFYRETDFGSVSASATAGSGMPLYLKGNWLAAGRFSYGVLNRDNYSLGLSAAYGRTLETMGYHLMSDEPQDFRMASVDATHLWNNIENRFELMAGRRLGHASYAFFLRSGMGLLDESRLKLEAQPVYTRMGDAWDWSISAGVTFQAASDLSLRAMYAYGHAADDSRIVIQAYYYRKIL